MIWTSEKLLTAIRDAKLDECITEAQLVTLTGLTSRQVLDGCVKLREHQMLQRTAQGCYRLTHSGREALQAGKTSLRSGPKGSQESGRRVVSDTLRERVWRAIRIRRKITVPEIITLVVQGDEKGDVTSNVQKYIKALNRAGYLVLLKRREPCASPRSPGYKRWWLPEDKDTGPQAPVWSEGKQQVYDPNTETVIDISETKSAKTGTEVAT